MADFINEKVAMVPSSIAPGIPQKAHLGPEMFTAARVPPQCTPPLGFVSIPSRRKLEHESATRSERWFAVAWIAEKQYEEDIWDKSKSKSQKPPGGGPIDK